MNDITCESIKEKILLCEELTDAEKEHIAHCEECRAASLQTQKMISDLGKMSVPGIEEGKLADRVMKEIRNSKVFYFPKFKLSNHIGTVAALAVVVAMFAAVKLSDTARLDVNTSEGVDLGEYAALTETCNEADSSAAEEEIASSDNAVKFMAFDELKEKMSDDSDIAQNSAIEEKAPKLMYAARGASSEEKSFESTNAVDNEDVDSLDDDVPMDSKFMVTNGASGGGSAAVKDYGEEIFEEAVSVEAEEEEAHEMLFPSELFDENNTLEENVDIANQYVKSIYEDANVLKTATLYEMQVTNELFLAWIATVENVGEYTFETLYSHVQNN